MTITLTPEQFKEHLEQERRLSIRCNPPEIMDAAEFAIFMDRDLDTVYSKVALDEYPYIKDGRRVFFPKWAVVAWLKGEIKGGEIKRKVKS